MKDQKIYHLFRVFKKVFVLPIYWCCYVVEKFVIDNHYLVSHRHRSLVPRWYSYPVWLFLASTRYLSRQFRAGYLDFRIQRYANLVDRHYEEHRGRAYRNYHSLSVSERVHIYSKQRGRVAPIIQAYPHILLYADGDKFLDVGCGRGQNIIELSKSFPNSQISGFDVNSEALDIVAAGTSSNAKINTFVGDIKDTQFLRTFTPGSVDHVVVSHVFSFLLDQGGERDTVSFRQKIIDHLMEIARESVLILDSGASSLNFGEPSLQVEQKGRAHYQDMILQYFVSHQAVGHPVILYSNKSVGVLFRKELK